MSFSQDIPNKEEDTRTRVVKVSTLKLIKKDLDKCDSLKVAFNNQSVIFDELVKSNLYYFEEVKKVENERDSFEKKLKESIKALDKKKGNWLLPSGIGTILGLILGVIISK